MSKIHKVIEKTLHDFAKRIVRVNDNAVDAVGEGLRAGIAIGRDAERNEIIDLLKKRNGETDEDEACDETTPVAGSAGHR